MTRLLRKTRSRIEAPRARVLLLLHEGVALGVVAEMAGCARATVYHTLYRFQNHVTRNHTHRTIEPLTEAVDRFIGR